jgi:HlyD family secretion protein
VILVPNAALRFTPPAPEKAATKERGSLFGRLFPRPSSPAKEKGSLGDQRQRSLWTLRDGEPLELPVEVGPTDGLVTQVVSGDLAAGTPLLVDVIAAGR